VVGPLSQPSLEPRSWHDDWSGLRVAILGLGPEGFAVADTLAEKAATAEVFSHLPHPDFEAILGVLGVGTTVMEDAASLQLAIEAFAPDWVVAASVDEVFRHVLSDLRDKGRRVLSITELSLRLADKIPPRCLNVFIGGAADTEDIAELAGRFLSVAGFRVAVAGGQFPPALDALRNPEGLDVLLWCLDDRELDNIALDQPSVRSPEVTVALGHDSLTQAQLSALYANTSRACVYRRGDETERAVEDAFVVEGARAIGVGLDTPGMSDLGLVEDIVCDRAFLDDRRNRALELTTLEELARAGFRIPVELERALAACAIARCCGVSPEVIGGVLREAGPL
jgi:UDP-N-acetylmuramoylalanine--D-glutamate ligase